MNTNKGLAELSRHNQMSKTTQKKQYHQSIFTMPNSTKQGNKGHKYNRSLDLGKYDFNRKTRCDINKFVSADRGHHHRGVIDENNIVIASSNNI